MGMAGARGAQGKRGVPGVAGPAGQAGAQGMSVSLSSEIISVFIFLKIKFKNLFSFTIFVMLQNAMFS